MRVQIEGQLCAVRLVIVARELLKASALQGGRSAKAQGLAVPIRLGTRRPSAVQIPRRSRPKGFGGPFKVRVQLPSRKLAMPRGSSHRRAVFAGAPVQRERRSRANSPLVTT